MPRNAHQFQSENVEGQGYHADYCLNRQEGWLSPTESASVSAISQPKTHYLATSLEYHAGMSLHLKKRTVAPTFVRTESLLSRAIFKKVFGAFYRGWFAVVNPCSNFSLRLQMAPLRSIKFQTADFPIFCARIIVIFWTTCIAREVFSVLVMGNGKHNTSCRYCSDSKEALLLFLVSQFVCLTVNNSKSCG